MRFHKNKYVNYSKKVGREEAEDSNDPQKN